MAAPYCQFYHAVNFEDLPCDMAAMEVVQVMIRAKAVVKRAAPCGVLRHRDAFCATRLPSFLSSFLAFARCYPLLG
ncbi:hypothetical protein BXA22_10900 [Edwardsiella piscicida]|nr:hypothetical protein BXA22_10900 [Edwardsiella piscicida]QBB12853.1 hypothetical protein EVK84_10070 [Edwardsiella piscicida]